MAQAYARVNRAWLEFPLFLCHFQEHAWNFHRCRQEVGELSQDIDRKLCLTAAMLGAVSRKDLATAFRRVNPATTFDLDRAHKWLQGRARPRDAALYEDWAALLEIGKTGFWVANCPLAEFAAALAARGPLAADTLQERADAFRGGAVLEPGQAPELTGSYVCYSHAWSPYFRGRIIRGELSIAISGATRRLVARYSEHLPTGPIRTEGSVTLADRAIHLDLRAPGGVHLVFCLFPASAPASLLGGLMCGATIIGPDSQPSVTRIVMVRLPPRVGTSPEADPYLPAGSLITADLARLGLPLAEPERVEAGLAAFLHGGDGGGLDQIRVQSFRPLVELFDRQWFARAAALA